MCGSRAEREAAVMSGPDQRKSCFEVLTFTAVFLKKVSTAQPRTLEGRGISCLSVPENIWSIVFIVQYMATHLSIRLSASGIILLM